MRWRVVLAWYDGQICLRGVFRSEKAAMNAAKRAIENWRAGVPFPEWSGSDYDGSEPTVKLVQVPAIRSAAEEALVKASPRKARESSDDVLEPISPLLSRGVR